MSEHDLESFDLSRLVLNEAPPNVALIVYEHLITILQEYQVIWRRKISIPKVLFVINRYGLLTFGIVYLLSTFMWWPDDLVCLILTHTGINEV